MMPPSYSKAVNAKVPSESSEKADRIRRSWTQQTSCDISSAEEFPQLSDTGKNNPQTDVNRNHQVQKDFQFPDQACSSRSSPRFSSIKNRAVSVTPSQNRQSFNKSLLVSRTPDSLPLHPKTELIHTLVGLPMPRVSLEQALGTAEQCPVMNRAGMIRLLSTRVEEKRTSDDVLWRFQKKMEVVRQIGQRGVVHSVESEMKWIVLREEEEQTWFGEVGSRTRQATRKILGWMGEGVEVCEKHGEDAQLGERLATVGAVNVSHDNIDCDSSFKEEDWYVKKADKTSPRTEGEISEEESDEDWYMKPRPTSSMVSADSSYFNTLGKMTRSTLNNLVTIGNLTITAVAGNTTADEEKLPAVEDEVEEEGTCPMCQKVMKMKVLIGHASECEG